MDRTHVGDCREILQRMLADGVRVQTCVTSPHYWQLCDCGVTDQIGLEPTPSEYVAALVEVFRLVRQILSEDGTLWLNLGDSYANSGEPGHNLLNRFSERWSGGGHKYSALNKPYRSLARGFKPKDLMGIPWRVAFALQADGWYLRSDIIEEVEFYCPCGCGYVLEERVWRWSQDRDLVWKKPNPLPESVRDRPTRSHEYLFLFSRSRRYYFDIDAIKEPATCGAPNSPASIASPYGQGFTRRARVIGVGKNARPRKAVPNIGATRKALRSATENRHRALTTGGQSMQAHPNGMRHKRSVWTVATTPFSGAHFATFPRKLVEPCILAGSRPGDIVLDPFMGVGTVASVAEHLGRRFIGCELNPAYIELHDLRRRSLRLS
ncbi:MAG: site-specific DNA-methyltransferase [Steroidobacteraceae bacterium]|nr:site-specific DNA-methyltransferase [Steroidobacteraceae bacterium]